MDVIMILVLLLMLGIIYFSQSLLECWRFLRKAVRLPSNVPHPIFGHSLELMGPRSLIWDKTKKIISENPPLFLLWLGPVPLLVVHRPDHVETILGSSKYIDKSFQYKFMEPWLGTGLLTSKGSKWHSHRKMLTPTFHFAILENFVEVFSDKSRILVNKMQEAVGCDSVDIFPYITMCTLDIICETAMGLEINAMEEGGHSEYVTAVKEASNELMNRMISPWMFPDFIFNLSPSGRRFNKNLKILHDFTNKVIRERKELHKLKEDPSLNSNHINLGRKRKVTFLDLLLEVSESGDKITDEELREEVDTFMFEGHDTTAAGISWTMLLLASHPDIQENVFEELDNIFQGSDRSPSMKDLNDMKYLERALKDSLRIYPSVPIIGRQLKEDLEIDGLEIPAGMTAVFPIFITHRELDHFPDPETFDPDNFLPERVAARHPYAYIPFSAGPRNCIGQKFALLEEKTVLSYIIRNYKLKATSELPIPSPDLIVRPENGIHLKITPRFDK